MRINILLFTVWLILSNCKGGSTTEDGKGLEKVLIQQKMESIQLDNIEEDSLKHNPQKVKEYIQGAWFEPNEETAFFVVYDDTLIFLENIQSPFFYEINNDTLVFFYDSIREYSQRIIKADNDSLILVDRKRELVYVRRLLIQ